MGEITLDVRDHCAILTVDSPETRNGLTPAMGRQMVALCDEIDASPELAVTVVRGAGGTFCSGADRGTLNAPRGQADDAQYKDIGVVYQAFARVGQLQTATIAAVRGAAVGAGLNLMLASDLRVVATDARIIAGFLRIGIHPGGGFFTLANRQGGREATAALGLFGEEIDGRRAAELGLAWTHVPDEEVEPTAFGMAERVTADPELTRAAVRSFRVETGPPAVAWDVALGYERPTQMWSLQRRAAR
jgi:enoyl-CoA hydratase